MPSGLAGRYTLDLFYRPKLGTFRQGYAAFFDDSLSIRVRASLIIAGVCCT